MIIELFSENNNDIILLRMMIKIISLEMIIVLTFSTIDQNHVMEDHADGWHMTKNTYVEKDHVDEQHMTWNFNSEDHVDGWHVTESITAEDHGDRHHVTDITTM